jgi:hypothetical protein
MRGGTRTGHSLILCANASLAPGLEREQVGDSRAALFVFEVMKVLAVQPKAVSFIRLQLHFHHTRFPISIIGWIAE